MPHQTDYILRLTEQLAGLIRQALARRGAQDIEEPYEIAGQAIGLALDMDPTLASALSPQSLVSLLSLNGTHARVVALVQQALEVDAAARGSGRRGSGRVQTRAGGCGAVSAVDTGARVRWVALVVRTERLPHPTSGETGQVSPRA